MCLLMLVLSGCGTEKNDTVSYALEAEPASLDPAMTTGLAEANVQAELFEGLTRLDRDNQPQPALAERWDISPRWKDLHLSPAAGNHLERRYAHYGP